jgi:hypothetical protein
MAHGGGSCFPFLTRTGVASEMASETGGALSVVARSASWTTVAAGSSESVAGASPVTMA